jgi:hypothetical protein
MKLAVKRENHFIIHGGFMKNLFLIMVFLILMANSHATEGQLSSEFLESESVTYWILETANN